MSDRINAILVEIKGKVNQLKDSLSIERSENEKLRLELVELKEQLETKEKEASELQSKFADLSRTMNEKNEQVVGDSNGKYISEDEIDEMVKEIEYCIGQLKE